MEKRDSKDMFTEDGQDDWSNEQRQRAILAEEIGGLLQTHYPGQTQEHKSARLALMQEIFGTRSWKKIEEATPSKDLRTGLEAMRAKLEPPAVAEIDVDEVIEQIKAAPDVEIAALALDSARGHPEERRAVAVFEETWKQAA